MDRDVSEGKMRQRRRVSRLALASFLLGFLGFAHLPLMFLALVIGASSLTVVVMGLSVLPVCLAAIASGAVAAVKIGRKRDILKGEVIAFAGIALSGFGLIYLLITAYLIIIPHASTLQSNS